MVRLQTKYFYVCSTWSASVYYGSATINIASLPAWITGSLDTVNKVVSLEFDATGVTVGSYTYDLTAFSIVVTVQATCYTSMSACCTDAVNLTWLNRQGGWQNRYFDRVHGYDLQAAGAKTFIQDTTVKFQSVGKVYEGERIKIAVRNRDEYNYLVSLKYCLQAYVDGVPVLIQQESFPKYNENTTIYEIGCSFIWAKERTVQGQ